MKFRLAATVPGCIAKTTPVHVLRKKEPLPRLLTLYLPNRKSGMDHFRFIRSYTDRGLESAANVWHES